MIRIPAAIGRLLGVTHPAMAQTGMAQTGPVSLTLHDHQFAPACIEVPAGQEVVIYVGPLKPGSYDVIGEFSPKTAHGRIVAK